MIIGMIVRKINTIIIASKLKDENSSENNLLLSKGEKTKIIKVSMLKAKNINIKFITLFI